MENIKLSSRFEAIAKNINQSPNYAGFSVIGAGLPRTGTVSLKAALSILLDGACYHLANVAASQEVDLLHWEKSITGHIRKSEWINFFEGRGFRAGVDFPVALFYKTLLDVFPKSKVILTIRDPDKWYESVRCTIYELHRSTEGTRMGFLKITGQYRMVKTMSSILNYVPDGAGSEGLFDAIGSGRDAAIKYYKKWINQVKRTVPKDRLLIYNIDEGWEPLCRFLNKPKPNCPFPFIDDTVEIENNLPSLKMISYLSIFILPILISLLLAYNYNIRLKNK